MISSLIFNLAIHIKPKPSKIYLLFLSEEAMNISSIYLVAAAIACTFLWHVVESVWLRPRRLERSLRAQGLKGNSYRFWFGDTKDSARITLDVESKYLCLDDDIVPSLIPFPHHILTKYGKRSFIWHGPNPRIMIMNPDMIKDVLQKNETFIKVDRTPWTRVFVTGLARYNGEKWAKHRRLLNPSFAVAKLKGMVPLMHISCKELAEKLETMVFKKSAVEVDMWPILSKFTADVISRTAFGSNYNEGQRVFLLQQEQARLFVHLSRFTYIPGSRYLPTKMNKRMKNISTEIYDVLGGIIEKRMKGIKAQGCNGSNSDLLGILLESNIKEVEENGDKREMGITIQDVMDECKLLYFAGQETTSNLLVWTIVMLSIHQNWQIEAREEVFDAFGKSLPDFDSLHQLKKVNMILHEVLRLYPPAPAVLRTVKENTNLGDIMIQPGMDVLLPIVLIHHDKEIWGEDANEFKPERFSQGLAKATKGQLAAFLPFGLGPRICIGMNFAMVEAKLALAMMLQRFSFELSPSYEHAPVAVPTVQPKFGAKIMVSKI